MKCPRCEFDNCETFPHCDNTFGCSKCGLAFTRGEKNE